MTIACGLSGPARPYAGSARDFVLGTRVLTGRAEVLAQFPMGRVVEPDELAWIVLLAVSGKADALTGGVIDLSGASYLH